MKKIEQQSVFGFTLLEVLVVIIIIGSMAALVIPSYSVHIERVRASEGVSNLTALLAAQKRYQLENSIYAVSLASLDIDVAASNNFDIPSVANNAAAVAKIVRSDGNYTLCISDIGVVTCDGLPEAAAVCAQYTIGTCS